MCGTKEQMKDKELEKRSSLPNDQSDLSMVGYLETMADNAAHQIFQKCRSDREKIDQEISKLEKLDEDFHDVVRSKVLWLLEYL